ncbi:polysaccharide biosynthesis tyrosine autokinase [Chamaesiphon sp. OTE_75_metabat_556]|uniref:GumC family protein n=1 Tax=Chamaesiphon sp. OTE_75_metabat_556 TaxID=2964692 RepID=UPI00286A4E4B|nr:polysaccharide biosynthesis tyrosine autokinase [Chamaesiphon sp. OTE_75_metabat_556]
MESQESIDLNLSHYLVAVKRHWIPAVTIFAATLALSMVGASLLKPTYQAEGKLLFKSPTFKVIGPNLVPTTMEGGESNDLKSLVSTQNPISTQMEVITSRPLLQKTIEQLQLKNDRGKLLEPSELQAGLTTKIVGGADILQVSYKGRNPQDAAKIVNTLMNVYLENDIQIGQTEAETAQKFMDRQLPRTQAATNMAEVAIRKFKQQNKIVDLAEEAKSAVSIIGNLDTNINTIQSELEQVNAQSQELHKKIGLNSQEAIVVSAVSQSPAIQGIITQIQDIDRQLAIESSRFSENNPLIISLNEKKSKLTTLLQQQVRRTIGERSAILPGLLKISELKQNLIADLLRADVQQTGLAKKLTSLQNSRSAYEKRVSVIPQLSQTQHLLERQLEVSQTTYQLLLKKIQELQLAKHKNISNARIVASAVIPSKPETTTKLLLQVVGGLLGAFLGTSAIAYLEIRDKSLKTVAEIEKAFGYTLLGAIPAGKKLKTRPRNRQPVSTSLEVAVRDTPQSLTSEMSRSIQANLRFLSTDRPIHTIAVTSAVANEGKSKVAANLAAAIAGLGQRVLLIDADLRVPYQHRFWKLPLKRGLSELLATKSKFKLQQLSWTVMDNLDILTAGSQPIHPLACLESPQMRLLLQQVTDFYDFVIIDTPPILVASDALTIGRMTDGIIVVSRPGVIDVNTARSAREQLEMSHCDVLGVVVNGVISKYETEDRFTAIAQYHSLEPDSEAPWGDYMTQLGATIAGQIEQDTKFTDFNTPTTMLGKVDKPRRRNRA